MQPIYLYSAIITKVVDGDTVDALVDLGFSIFSKVRFRLYGIDTPEKNASDPAVRALGMAASEYVKNTLLDREVTIRSVTKDKYGRWLGVIYLSPDQPTLNEQLIALGHAKAYFGGNKQNLNWGIFDDNL